MDGAVPVRRSRRYRKKRKPFFARMLALISGLARAATIDPWRRFRERLNERRRSAASTLRYLVILLCTIVAAGPLNSTEAHLSGLWTPGLLGWAGINSDGFLCRDDGENRSLARYDEPADNTYAAASHASNPGNHHGESARAGGTLPASFTWGDGHSGAAGNSAGETGTHVLGSLSDRLAGALGSGSTGAPGGNNFSADTHSFGGPYGGAGWNSGAPSSPHSQGGSPGVPGNPGHNSPDFNYAVPSTPTGWFNPPGHTDENCCGGKESEPLVGSNFQPTEFPGEDTLPGNESPNNPAGPGGPLLLTTVPEPASVALLALGLVAVSFSRRRQT